MHIRIYHEKVQHLGNLFVIVSSDEENLEEDSDFSNDEEYYTDHDFSTEIEPVSEKDVSDSNVLLKRWHKEMEKR